MSWPRIPLREVATLEREGESPSSLSPDTPYLGLEHINGDGTLRASATVGSAELKSTKFRFCAEHVLFGKLRPYLRKIARPVFDGVCSTDIIPIRPGERLDRSFLFHFLRLPAMVALATSRCSGANLPRLSPKQLENFEVPVPPLAEQKRIVAILDAADDLRVKRRATLRELEDLRCSVFRDMFGRSSDNRWPIVTVADCGRVQLGRQRSPKYQTGKHTCHYLRVANVFEDRIDLSDLNAMDFNAQDLEAYRLHYGDILLNEGQSTELVGRPAIWRGELENCCFQNTLIRFQASPEVVVPEYALAVFLEFLRTGAFAKVSTKTSSVAHLGAARFAKMQLQLPPRALQSRFAAIVQAVESQKMRLVTQFAELDSLFASLQVRAFSGELCSTPASRHHASA